MIFLDRILHSSWKPERFPKYPRIKKSEFRSWNEQMFKKYTNERIYYHPNPIIRFIERRRVKQILSELNPIKSSDLILAAGCGEGYIEKQIAKGHLVLVDLSKEAIYRAKENLNERKNVKFVIADLERLPFSSSTFDKIECSEVIEHVYSPENVMRELKRVLKKGGILVASFPNEPLINFLKKILIYLRIFNIFFPNVPKDMTKEWHLHAFELNRFKEIADKIGWKVISAESLPFGFLPIRYVVKCKKVNE